MTEDVILRVNGVSKQYRLGVLGTGTISHDLNRWWHKMRGKPDPYLTIGDVNDRSKEGFSEYVWALKDINFEVKRGEVLGIIGKNGAGKSTLLKILSQVTSPTTGSIKSKGRIASLLEVGTGFHPEMTGKENIYLNGAILGMTKKEITSKLDEIIDFSGCQRYINTPVKRYSSGMKVRLAFAVAAFLEPEILVVDEVLAVGDAEFQKKAIGKMQDISNSDGRTVLFVSHNMAAVKNLCSRSLILENGKIAMEGDTYEVVNHYLQLNENTSTLDLDQREDRIGGEKFRFTNVKILNDQGDYVSQVISGDYVKFEISYKSLRNFNSKEFILGLNIQDNYGDLVTGLSTIETGLRVSELKDSGKIYWEIPSLLLRGGSYNLRLFSSYKTSQERDFLDVVENAIQFNVLRGDYWDKGVTNRSGVDMILPSKLI